jgi:hypothetical protein
MRAWRLALGSLVRGLVICHYSICAAFSEEIVREKLPAKIGRSVRLAFSARPQRAPNKERQGLAGQGPSGAVGFALEPDPAAPGISDKESCNRPADVATLIDVFADRFDEISQYI